MQLSQERAGIGAPLAKQPGQGSFNAFIEMGKLLPLVWKLFRYFA